MNTSMKNDKNKNKMMKNKKKVDGEEKKKKKKKATKEKQKKNKWQEISESRHECSRRTRILDRDSLVSACACGRGT